MSKVNGSYAIRKDVKEMLRYLAEVQGSTMSEIIERLVIKEMQDTIGDAVDLEPEVTYVKRLTAKMNETILDYNEEKPFKW